MRPREVREVKMLEQINRKINLMQLTKDEIQKTYASLSKLIIRKDAFMTLQHLVPNRVEILPNQPKYLKIAV